MYNFIVLLLIHHFCFAAPSDLQEMIKRLEREHLAIPPVSLPRLTPIRTYYGITIRNDVFDRNRAKQYDTTLQTYYQDYNLNQLQMVGYMEYHGVYAFIKTPFETIKIKVGEKIKGGEIVRITESETEINDTQIIDNKIYNKKVFLPLQIKK